VKRLLIPTWSQFKGWSLPTRASYAFGIVGIILALVALVPHRLRTPERAPRQADDEAERDIEEVPGVDASTNEQIRHLLGDGATCAAARDLLVTLKPSAVSPRATQVINGLIVASFSGEARYKDGLLFLLQEATAGLAATDHRYRFQFHSLLRKLAVRDGWDAASALISELRSSFSRPELSYVWPAIPLGKMEALHDGKTTFEEKYQFAAEDRAHLLNVILAHPDDPFLDYAYYFTGSYQAVLDRYPASEIRDTTLAAGTIAASDCRTARTCTPDTALRYAERLAAEFPDRLQDVLDIAVPALAQGGRLDDALRLGRIGCGRKCEETVESILSAAHAPTTSFVAIVDWLARNAPKELAHLDDHADWFDETPPEIDDGDFGAALAIIARNRAACGAHRLKVPHLFAELEGRLEPLAALAQRRDDDGVFALALAEIRAAQDFPRCDLRSTAIQTLERLEEGLVQRDPHSPLAPKASYLRASQLRGRGDYATAEEVVDEFLVRYPRTDPLYDDMLAERGVYFLLVQMDVLRARAVFEQVAAEFPAGNAADNSLNWEAWSQARDCNYDDALATYSRIAAGYPTSRLGIRARARVIALRGFLATRVRHNGFDGLLLSRRGPAQVVRVVPHSEAARRGFELGDVVDRVGSTAVDSSAQVYGLLTGYPPGIEVSLHLLRRGDAILTLPLRQVFYTPLAYPAADCGI
jgi:tetratricopeptide (TPR) repeat protein